MNRPDLWTRCYRVTLLTLPAALRNKHGASMQQMFAREVASAREQGSWTVTLLALRAMGDAITRGAYERLRNSGHAEYEGESLFAHAPAPGALLWRLFTTFTAAFAMLTTCFVALSVSRLLAEEIPARRVLDFAVLSVPFTAAMTAPMSVFLAVLVVLLRISRSSGTGVPPTRRGPRPVLLCTMLFAAAIGAANLVLTTELVPRANARYEHMLSGQVAPHGDRSMTLAQLQARQVALDAEARRTGSREARVVATGNQVEIQKKYSLATACIVLALMAVAISVLWPAAGAPMIIGASLMVYGGYYAGMMSGEAMADALVVSPFLAMWGANLTLLALAAPMLWLRRRHFGAPRAGIG